MVLPVRVLTKICISCGSKSRAVNECEGERVSKECYEQGGVNGCSLGETDALMKDPAESVQLSIQPRMDLKLWYLLVTCRMLQWGVCVWVS